MQSRYTDTINHIYTWSQQTQEIEGVIVIGSQARNVMQADQWSDLDLMMLVHTPDVFLSGNQWLNRFGKVVCVFNDVTPLHFTSWDWCVKRVLFDDNRDIDFSILPYDHLDEVLAVNQSIIMQGYQVIYDEHVPLLESKIDALMTPDHESVAQLPTEDELNNTINDLLYHIVWAFKKILRKELWVAVCDINQHISSRLLRLIEWHTVSTMSHSPAITYDGRFLEMRASGEIIGRLRNCFTAYDQTDAIEALGQLINVTQFVSQELYAACGYAPNVEQFALVNKLYCAMKTHA